MREHTFGLIPRAAMRVSMLLLLTCLVPAAAHPQEAPYPVFAGDLESPTKVLVVTQDLILAAEAGRGDNDGRVSLFNAAGERRTLIDGLPSGMEPVMAVSGPNSIAYQNRTLYISIGIGNTLMGPSMQPATGRSVNPTPLSPIFSSILEVQFGSEVDFEVGPFTLSRTEHDQLANGSSVTLVNDKGESAVCRRLVDFAPKAVLDRSLPGYRGPDPLDLVLDSDDPGVMYVTDGGLSRLVKVQTATGHTEDFVQFDKVPKPPGVVLGPALIDPFPTGARQRGRWLYVSMLTGFPFAQRASQIRRVHLDSRANELFIGDLTSCVDVLPSADGSFFVLQLSTNLFAIPPRLPAPGRLLRFVDPPAAGGVLFADGLTLPNSMTQHPVSGEIFIVEIGAGRIIRIESH